LAPARVGDTRRHFSDRRPPMTKKQERLAEAIGDVANDPNETDRKELFVMLLSAACAVFIRSAINPYVDPKGAEDLVATVARESFRHTLKVGKKHDKEQGGTGSGAMSMDDAMAMIRGARSRDVS
jgi:hypothetical protein